jgi:GT2 family glycosyltransferase
MYSAALAGSSHELVAISDARGITEGCNRGMAVSRGKYVIFSDDDVEFLSPDLAEKLLGHMSHCDLLGVAGTRLLTAPGWRMAGPPHLYGQIAFPDNPSGFSVNVWSIPSRRVDKMQAMDAVFLCTLREVAVRIGFDQETFPGPHLYDIDFTYRAFLAGLRLAVATDLYPIDYSPASYDRDWIPDAQAFIQKFGRRLPMRPLPGFHNTIVPAATREDIVKLMTPPHWDD